jgi:hypothetical protein
MATMAAGMTNMATITQQAPQPDNYSILGAGRMHMMDNPQAVNPMNIFRIEESESEEKPAVEQPIVAEAG